MAKILRYVLGLVKTVVLGVSIEGDSIVVRVRPHRREQLRCPACGRRCECHDHEPTRRWRAMDLARSGCRLEHRPTRVRCPEHGVAVAKEAGIELTDDQLESISGGWVAKDKGDIAPAEECHGLAW